MDGVSYACFPVFFFLALTTVESAGGEEAILSRFLRQYCVSCHGADEEKGDIRLDDAWTDFADPVEHRETWLAILEQLETREMPPDDPIPSEREYEEIAKVVEARANRIDWTKVRHPGHVTLPRLTRVEYSNTMRDLLGIDPDAGRFLSPDGEGKSGFTNDRDNLFLAPSEWEKAFAAAERVIDALQSLGRERLALRLEAEEMFMTESRSQVSDFPDGSRGYQLTIGQKTLYESIEIPAAGLYRVRIRGASSTSGETAALVRIDNQLVTRLPFAGRTFAVAGDEIFLLPGSHQLAVNTRLPPRERGDRANPVFRPLPKNASDLVGERAPKNAPRIPAGWAEEAELARLVARWNAIESSVQRPYEWIRLHGREGDWREIRRFKGYADERRALLDDLGDEIAAGLGMSRAAFDRRYREWNEKALAERAEFDSYPSEDPDPRPGVVWVDWIEVTGPVKPEDETRRRTATEASAALTGEAAWSAWYADFLERAFRAPVETSVSDRYRGIYRDARDEGASHEVAAKRAVAAALVSPRFLYRAGELPADARDEVAVLDDWQLAARLSYFLWKSLPDEELREAARKGTLSDPGALRRQVVRLLGDDKANAFYEAFPGQWLGYEALGSSVNPDASRFPEFTSALATAMKEETRLFFQDVFRKDRPISSLLTSGETYLNRTLSRHYGIDGGGGSEMTRVVLTPEQREKRGGILGMGSVLTATSTPVRTSPVLRGVWVMEKLLGDEPGEPPADAGELPGNAGKRGKSLREELAIHRDRADCAFCHDKIDPLGFGLEEFDAIGRLREGDEVDATGTLPDGTEFEGVAELRDYLAGERLDDFAENLARRLLAFALGRELQVYDEPALEAILAKTRAADYRARGLVEEVVLSYPFTHQHVSPELELSDSAVTKP